MRSIKWRTPARRSAVNLAVYPFLLVLDGHQGYSHPIRYGVAQYEFEMGWANAGEELVRGRMLSSTLAEPATIGVGLSSDFLDLDFVGDFDVARPMFCAEGTRTGAEEDAIIVEVVLLVVAAVYGLL